MKEYINGADFQLLLKDIIQKLENNRIDECQMMMRCIVSDAEQGDKYIDRTYLGDVREKKKMAIITEINALMNDMTVEQLENIQVYVVDEHSEPNHEALALEAITKLSRGIQKVDIGEVK